MIRYTGQRIALEALWSAVRSHLSGRLVRDPDRIRANPPCCVGATGGRPEDHVEKRPAVAPRIVVGSPAVAAAEFVGDRPVFADVVIEDSGLRDFAASHPDEAEVVMYEMRWDRITASVARR